ncbi:MAG TPA: DMP19 family protein [Pyrinomonadaceae bacterium]|nr:DMP19 family protein [Pyrinomonadaceae bacterium]HMP65357.1 DMP19 family protein [Pyrinomonadaceae bacterium]
MSAGVLILLTIVVLGILVAIALIAFNRWIDMQEDPGEKDNLHGMIDSYGEIRRKLASGTPRGLRRIELAMAPIDIVMLVECLEGEVNNGGFDQFFFNSSGDYAKETIDALKQIGAHQTAEIVQLACDRFPHGSPPIDISLRRTLMLETVSPDADAFIDLEERFYSYEEPISDLLEMFKEKHSI